MNPLTVWTLVAVAVALAALVELVRMVRGDGYGLRCPPRQAPYFPGLPDGPYSRRPPR
jgi:hypothetical protein